MKIVIDRQFTYHYAITEFEITEGGGNIRTHASGIDDISDAILTREQIERENPSLEGELHITVTVKEKSRKK